MNIDRLFIYVKKNFSKLRDVDLTLKFLRYHIELLEWKKKKLKLGAIVFEIKETYFNGILILEDIDIRYIRQDNTDTDAVKIENRLKAIGWKWDLKNLLSLLTVFFIASVNLYNYFYQWYCRNLPTIAYRQEHYDFVVRHGIENSFSTKGVGFFKNQLSLSYWVVDVISDFCIYFNILL